MQVTFVRQWRRHKAGSTLELPDGVATTLIRRGVAVEKKPAAAKAAKAQAKNR